MTTASESEHLPVLGACQPQWYAPGEGPGQAEEMTHDPVTEHSPPHTPSSLSAPVKPPQPKQCQGSCNGTGTVVSWTWLTPLVLSWDSRE